MFLESKKMNVFEALRGNPAPDHDNNIYEYDMSRISRHVTSTKISTIKNFKSAIYTMKIAQRLLLSVLLHHRHLYRASNTFPIL